MTAAPDGTRGGFDFRPLFDSASAASVSRPAAEAAILQRLAKVAAGCVAVVGEPGSGKSILAARLIARNGWCCHFLRMGHTEFTLWRDPYAFLASLGFQLQAAFGDEIFPETAAIDVTGRVHDVGRGGSVVGADIARLVSVPWRQARISVKLEARGVAGDVAGVRIGEVVEEYRGLPLAAFRDLALVEPLRRLAVLKPAARVVLWVDGLDEDRAAAGAGPATIGGVLPLGSECRHLGNLALVLSSRRGGHLDRFLEDGAEVVELDAPELGSDTDRALADIIERELGGAEVASRLAKLDWPAGELRRALLERSERNFLFVRQFFEAVRCGQGAALREGGLPAGLDDIHVRLLSAIVRDHGPGYAVELHPLLEVLTVAEAPLAPAHLARFSGLPPGTLPDAFARLKPLLDATDGGDAGTVHSWYHKSIRDCIASPRHVGAPWRVDPPAAHRRIADAYVSADGESARDVDGYGFLFATRHLSNAGDDGARRLLRLMHDGWRSGSRGAFGSNRAFHQDLARAATRAAELPAPEACLATVRCATMDVYVRDAERHVPADVLELLARLGQAQRAIDSVPQGVDPIERALFVRAVVRGLVGQGPDQLRLAANLVADAVNRMSDSGLWFVPRAAALFAAWPTAAAPALREALEAMHGTFAGRHDDDPAPLLVELARLRTAIDGEPARETFARAWPAALASKYPDATETLGRLLSAWADFDPDDAFTRLQGAGLQIDRHVAAGLLRVAAAGERKGRAGVLAGCAQWLLGVPERPDGNPLHRAAIWLEIARHAVERRAEFDLDSLLDGSRQRLSAARAARVAKSRDPNDFDADEIRLLVDLAEVEPRDRDGGSRTAAALDEAWTAALATTSATDDDWARLVRRQFEVGPALLEAYVNSAPEAVQDRVRFALVREGLWTSGPAWKQTLDRIERKAEAAERPKPTGWSFFHFGLARACAPHERERASALLREVSGDHSAWIRWRLDLLPRVAAADPAAAKPWLHETVRAWAEGPMSAHFVDELPATLADLSSESLEGLSELTSAAGAAPHRRFLAAVLARRAPASDAALRDARIEVACTAAAPADPRREVPECLILGFVAGQLRSVDAARADAVWQRAAAPFATPVAPTDPEGMYRYVQACAALRGLHWGAPDLAIPLLAELRKPPPAPNARMFVAPAPVVSPYSVATMPEHEILWARALVRASAQHRALVEEALKNAPGPAARVLALCLLGQIAGVAHLPQRVARCDRAAQEVTGVAPPQLQSLLRSEIAKTYLHLGLASKAREVAAATARLVLDRAPNLDTVVLHPHACALGRCVAVAIRCEDWRTAWSWLWEGRTLGMHGFHVMLGEVPEAMNAVAPIEFDAFDLALQEGGRLYLSAG